MGSSGEQSPAVVHTYQGLTPAVRKTQRWTLHYNAEVFNCLLMCTVIDCDQNTEKEVGVGPYFLKVSLFVKINLKIKANLNSFHNKWLQEWGVFYYTLENLMLKGVGKSLFTCQFISQGILHATAVYIKIIKKYLIFSRVHQDSNSLLSVLQLKNFDLSKCPKFLTFQ